jgi:hypothetical protein
MRVSTPSALKALDPIWFRFTDPEDAGKYGDRWWKYDEGSILRMRAREQIALETEMGMTLVAVMNGFRASSVLGDTAVSWLAVHQVDPARAGDFDDFNPITMMIQWTSSDPEPGPKGDVPAGTPRPEESDSPTADGQPNMISEMPDTVALPVMPIAG